MKNYAYGLPSEILPQVLESLGINRSMFESSYSDYSDLYGIFKSKFKYELVSEDDERGLYSNFKDGGDLWGESYIYWKEEIIGEVVAVHNEIRYLSFNKEAVKVIEYATEVYLTQARNKFSALKDSIIMIGDLDDFY